MALDRLFLENSRRQRLAATLHRAQGPVRGGAVVCHGLLSSRASLKHRELCRALAWAGVRALRFDFAGRGESEGLMEELTYQGEVEDLAAAVTFLRREVDHVALVGSSMGGAVALLYAAQAPDVRAVVGIATVGEPAKVLPGLGPDDPFRPAERLQGGLGPAFVQSAQQTNVLAAVATLRCPLLLIHGDRDDVVPLAQAQALAQAAPRGQLEVIEGADHFFRRPGDLAQLARRVGEFVSQALSS